MSSIISLNPSNSSTPAPSNYILQNSSATLAVNNRYIGTVSRLIYTLPSSPSIGDLIIVASEYFPINIRKATGNTDAGIVIDNSGTVTATQNTQGIYLEGYSTVTLVYTASNFWVVTTKTGAVYNWVPPTVTSPPSNYTANYTPSLYNAGYTTNNPIANIASGVNGGITFSGNPDSNYSYSVLVSLTDYTFVGGITLTLASNAPTSVSVYAGKTINSSNLIGTYSITGSVIVFTNNYQFKDYLFVFTNGTNTLTIGQMTLGLSASVNGKVSVNSSVDTTQFANNISKVLQAGSNVSLTKSGSNITISSSSSGDLGFANPMTAQGDLIISADSSGTLDRLPANSENQVKFLSQIGAAPVLWTPANISTALWLDPSDPSTVFTTSSLVTQVNDKSGNNRNAVQTTTGYQPNLSSTINSLSTLTFTGNQWLEVAANFSFQSCMIVFRDTTNVNYYQGYLAIRSSGYGLFVPASVTNTPLILGHVNTTQVTQDGNTSVSYFNGIQEFSITQDGVTPNFAYLEYPSSSGTGMKYLIIGSDSAYDGSGNRALRGSIGEILFFDTALSTNNRQKLEGYLAWKWGLQANLPSDHPYKSAAPLSVAAGSVMTSWKSINNYQVLATNSNLLVNSDYYSSITGLIHTLPNASIGDTINISTGNFDTIVYQNTGDRILNLSTLSTSGISNGIILKPYSDISLVYKESGLWVSSYRSRTINMWTIPIITGGHPVTLSNVTASMPAFTGLGSTIAGLTDGNTVAGSGFAYGYYSNGSPAANVGIDFTLTLTTATELDGFNFWGGQGNSGGELSNIPNSCSVYSDTSKTNLLGTFTVQRIIGEQTFSLNLNGVTYSSYTFNFSHTDKVANIAIMELQLTCKQIDSGGETVAV